ncbi:hypothetical protein F3Y22_tig00111504pilonHSYRG00004 [Hibiscus syriacus]|uniref:Uncharacterized protein n=1 Tax=Hibiscus syriacus TaxID=106335 RepID=A0A6A2YJL3_HIBSY|nr:hypothetical protein F3Y22_tig00111504pilonHSYRG00004 [Hibiscus syriacus]
MVSFRSTNASTYCSRQPLSADTVIGSLEYLGCAAIFVAALIALLVRSVMAFISITTTDRGSVLPLKNGATDLMQRREYEVSEHRVLIRGFEAAVDGCGIGVGTGAEAVVGAEAGGCGLTQMTGLKKMMQQKNFFYSGIIIQQESVNHISNVKDNATNISKFFMNPRHRRHSVRLRRKTGVTFIVIIRGVNNKVFGRVDFVNRNIIHGLFQAFKASPCSSRKAFRPDTIFGSWEYLGSRPSLFRCVVLDDCGIVLLPQTVIYEDCESMEKEDYEIFVAQDSTNCVVAVVDDEPPLLPQQVGVDKTMEVRATCGSPIFDHEKITTILEGLSIGSKTFVIVLTMSHDPITLDGVVSLLLDVELEQKGFDQFEGLSLSASVAEGLRRPSQSFGSQGGRSQGHQEDRGVVYDFSANCVAKMVTLLTGVGTVQGKWFIDSEVTHHVTTKPGDALDEADYSGADK